MTKQYDLISREFKKGYEERAASITRQIIYSLIKNTHSEKKLLDLGCGYGEDLKHFSEKGYNIYGIDISREMLKLSKDMCPQSKLYLGSFENLPYNNNSFDIVYSRYAIQHSGKVPKVLKEAHRVLKPRGELVFLVTHPLRQFIEKKEKDYWKKENISSKILGNKIIVEEPSHTLDEYLSQFVLEHFRIKKFIEKHDPDAEQINGQRYPGVLIMQLEKEG